MPNGLYERDALAWAEQQAALLRRLAAGEGVSEAVDWPNVIEELQDVGLSELRACRSLLQQAMGHLLKLYALPDCQDATHWRDEAGTFLDDAEQRFTPSMRQRIDLDELYAKALRRARVVLADSNVPSRTLPEVCPFLMSELLGGNVGDLVVRLNTSVLPGTSE